MVLGEERILGHHRTDAQVVGGKQVGSVVVKAKSWIRCRRGRRRRYLLQKYSVSILLTNKNPLLSLLSSVLVSNNRLLAPPVSSLIDDPRFRPALSGGVGS